MSYHGMVVRSNAQHITGDIVGRYKMERKAYAHDFKQLILPVMTALE